MISVAELFANTNYAFPNWIKNHDAFNAVKYIRKVFPSLGLENFSEDYKVDNRGPVENYALALIGDMKTVCDKRVVKLEAFSKKGKIGKKRRAVLEKQLIALKELVKQLDKRALSFDDKGKATLILNQDIKIGDDTFAKKGSRLFKLYGKISEVLKENSFLGLPPFEEWSNFKGFSSGNLPVHNTICFASDGPSGIWDIATMSMRGITSCQTWNEGQNQSIKVIGSIIDPFTGIIYLTNGQQHYGAQKMGVKMIRRCIVRYAFDSKDEKPYLLLEKMYPSVDESVVKGFVEALQKKSPNLEVHYSGHILLRPGESTIAGKSTCKLINSYLPLADELKKINPRLYPYVDTHLNFETSSNVEFAKFPQDIKDKLDLTDNIAELIRSIVKTKIKGIRAASYGEASRSFWLKIRGRACSCSNIACAEQHSHAAASKDAKLIINSLSCQLCQFLMDKGKNKVQEIPLVINEFKTDFCQLLSNSIRDFNPKVDEKFSNLIAGKIVAELKNEK